MYKKTVQDHWDRFARWERRYMVACADRASDNRFIEDCNPATWLFLASVDELEVIAHSGAEAVSSDVDRRIKSKLAFLSGYLVDISSDGPEVMGRKSDFLTLQYPGRCNNAFGFWFEQNMEGKPEVGAHHGFQGFNAQLFLRDAGDADFTSIRAVLPFDHLYIRQPLGEAWTSSAAETVLDTIRSDLAFDGLRFKSKLNGVGAEFLSVTLKWLRDL